MLALGGRAFASYIPDSLMPHDPISDGLIDIAGQTRNVLQSLLRFNVQQRFAVGHAVTQVVEVVQGRLDLPQTFNPGFNAGECVLDRFFPEVQLGRWLAVGPRDQMVPCAETELGDQVVVGDLSMLACMG